MKKISILGILAILVIVAEFTYAMIAGWVDMKNSFLEGYNSVNVHSGTPQPEYSGLFDKVYVDVRPLETTAVDSLTNRFADKSVPYQVKRIGTVIVPTVWSSIVNFFAMFAIIPFFVGIYCLIRLLVSISKREVFTSDNVARLRFFTYSFAALYGLMTLHDWLNHLEAVKHESACRRNKQGTFAILRRFSVRYERRHCRRYSDDSRPAQYPERPQRI